MTPPVNLKSPLLVLVLLHVHRLSIADLADKLGCSKTEAFALQLAVANALLPLILEGRP